jgi:hypothetical protein
MPAPGESTKGDGQDAVWRGNYPGGFIEGGKMIWISVEERLPEVSVTVLAWDKDDGPVVAERLIRKSLGDDGHWYVNWDGCIYPADITHWMPLPAPPKESP